VFTYTGVNPGINSSNAPNILGRSYAMSAEVDVPQGGGNGMLATMGGRWGGWGLYLLNGKPVFHYNMLILAQYRWEGTDALTPGKHTIGFDYTYDGPGIAKGGSGVLKVDGKIVATGTQANSIAFLQVADETFDVGLDTRTGVSADYQVPFAFNGKIDKLTVKLGPTLLTAADEAKKREATARARD
jgi:arylsulfatase